MPAEYVPDDHAPGGTRDFRQSRHVLQGVAGVPIARGTVRQVVGARHQREAAHILGLVVQEVEGLGLEGVLGMGPGRPVPVPAGVGLGAGMVAMADHFHGLDIRTRDLPEQRGDARVHGQIQPQVVVVVDVVHGVGVGPVTVPALDDAGLHHGLPGGRGLRLDFLIGRADLVQADGLHCVLDDDVAVFPEVVQFCLVEILHAGCPVRDWN